MESGKSVLDAFLSQLAPNLSYGETKAALVAEFERMYIERLLRASGGNITLAAKTARMDRKHLTDLIRKHHLEDVRKQSAFSNVDLRD